MLLSLSLVHILPEALEMYASYLKEHGDNDDGHDDHDHRRRILTNITRILSEKSEAKGKESEAKKEGHDDHGEEGGFPLVFFLFVVGFLVMLFFDQVLFK